MEGHKCNFRFNLIQIALINITYNICFSTFTQFTSNCTEGWLRLNNNSFYKNQ